jgi:DNA-binding CsgD family transcriptional regulator
MPRIAAHGHRRRARKLPQGNGLVLAVLRSRAHRLASGMVIELRYAGRRTGREYALPVQYARAGERLVIRPQDVQRSAWWRNFHTPTAVTVRLAGRIRRGTAQLLTAHEPAWEQARDLYRSRWRQPSTGTTGPLVLIALEPDSAVTGLTGHEAQLQRLVAAGKTNRAIAADLIVSDKTVARQMTDIFVKLGLSARSAASAYADEHNRPHPLHRLTHPATWWILPTHPRPADP